jgi:hypothetical protein
MNDNLPFRLPTLPTLFVFYDAGDLPMLAYLLTPTLLLSAFHRMAILIADRRYVLEIIAFYLPMHKKLRT